jgi:hypothetical protein
MNKPLVPTGPKQPQTQAAAPQTPSYISGTIQPDPSGRRRKSLPRMIEAMRELVQMGTDNPRMQEGYFIDFLHRVYNPDTDQFNVELWYRTFGTLRKGVDVTDSAGNVLFVCPQVVSVLKTRLGESKNLNGQEVIAVQRSDGKLVPTMDEIARNAKLQGNRHPMLEQRAMEQGLAVYKPEVAYDVHEAWRHVLSKYGLIKEKSASKTGMTADDLLSDEGEAL